MYSYAFREYFVFNQAVVPLLEGLEVDSNTYRLGLSQVIGSTRCH